MIDSFLSRTPPVWEYFPSQIQAIEAGLLTSTESSSLEMPTGAGKTTLWEPSSIGTPIGPYGCRNFACPLPRLGLRAKPLNGEPTQPDGYSRTSSLRRHRSAARSDQRSRRAKGDRGDTGSFDRSLGCEWRFLAKGLPCICDEGHLLDSRGRGVSLELLLARFKSRLSARPGSSSFLPLSRMWRE